MCVKLEPYQRNLVGSGKIEKAARHPTGKEIKSSLIVDDERLSLRSVIDCVTNRRVKMCAFSSLPQNRSALPRDFAGRKIVNAMR